MAVGQAVLRRRVAQFMSSLLAALAATGLLIPWPHAVTAAQSPSTCPERVALVNGSFESPVVSAGRFHQLDESNVSGWSTTASDNLIELWPTGFQGVPAAHGRQFAELNATQPSTLFQDVPTTPGQRLFWRLKHRGRDGQDRMALRIGPAGGTLATIQEMQDGRNSWGSYSGVYTVPANQTTSRFAFAAVTTASPNLSIGNFLDDIFFGTPPCVIVSKTVEPTGVAAPGTILTYQINARNEGGDVAESVTITDTIPTGATYEPGSLRIVSGSSAGAKTDAADSDEASFDGSKVIFALGDEAADGGPRRFRNVAGEPTGVTVEFRVRAGAAPAQITNAATATYTNLLASLAETLTSTSNDVTTTVTPLVDLSVAKRDLADPVPVGGTVTYVLDVRNDGPSPATGVIVSDPLPAGLTFVSATPSQGSCTAAISCTLGAIAVNGTATITIVATATTPGDITNTATITANEREGDPADNTRTETTVIFGQADVQVTKNAAPLNIVPGGNVTYTLTVTNNGPSPATNVVLTDQLSARLQFVSATPSQGSCTGTTAITCTLGQIASGGSATVTVVALGASVGQAINTAVVTANEPDPNGPNTATATVVVGVPPPSAADLRIAKTAPGGTVRSGSVARFVVTVTNDGPDTATSVRVVDTLPPGFTPVAATPSLGGPCTLGSVITCPIGTLTAGQSATVTIDVRAGPSRAAVNGAVVEGAETDPNPANNVTEAEIVVLPVIDLAITKTAAASEVRVGDVATFRLTIQNNSDAPALNVVVTDVIPSGATYLSSTTSQGGPCTLAGQRLTCPLTSLPARGSATIDVTMRANVAGTLHNLAVVSGDDQDTSAANNVAVATVEVSDNPQAPRADLVVQKTVSPTTASPGDTVRFTITVRNDGPDPATNVVLNDFLPVGLTVSAVDPSQGSCSTGRPSRCLIGALAVGAQASVTVRTRIDGIGEHANVSVAGGDQSDPDPTNNRATAVLTVDPDVPPSPEPEPAPPAEPSDNPANNDDEEDVKEQRPTEEERQQRERTNRSNKDDVHTEGNVVGARCTDDQPIPQLTVGFVAAPDDVPYALIATRDGVQQVRLLGDARLTCRSIQIGDYLEADGVKQHEQLFDADDVTRSRR